jgi:hypothetical protein
VRATAETLRLAAGYVDVKPLGPVAVKGLATAVEVVELGGVVPIRTHLQALAACGLTRFVRRQTELATLREALEHTSTGRDQVMAVVRARRRQNRLICQFTRSYHTQGWLVFESGTASYGRATPYFPVRDLFKSYSQIGDRDPVRRVRKKVTGTLRTLDPTWHRRCRPSSYS